MAVCTFFGHHDCPESVKEELKKEIEDLIMNYGVELFYAGECGAFDRLVLQVLNERTENLPCRVVLARTAFLKEGRDIPPHAVAFRQKQWMIDQADYVVVYLMRLLGDTACFADLAKKKGKIVINLAQEKA